MKSILFQIAAAITFFTRLPLWKIIEIPGETFRKIIHFWPLVGWITGGITALAWIGFSTLFPPLIAIIMAFVVRLLLTGALHEDGLGDFFDGFGGGRTKDDILRIMKDSHVGSYALIAIVLYFLLSINALNAFPATLMASIIFVADPLSKLLAALMMNLLPYARKESESKAKTIYDKLSVGRIFFAFLFGLLPMIWFLEAKLWLSILLPVATMLFILFYVKRKIGGYTGDICGATTLLCELSFYLGALMLVS